jgi:raffinose/stachyose/melibiose transport system permease protein
MTADRLNKIFSLVLIGIASFVSLLPIALAIMNALKTTVEMW